MSRAILLACWPCLAAMFIAFGVLLALVRLSGAKWNLPHLRRLHTCQEGSTQTVSFVLTLPVFIMVVLFIIQMSQLMIGTTVVHYAAYAAARSATVWIPATVVTEMVPYPGRDGEEFRRNDSANLFLQDFQKSDLATPSTYREVQRSTKLRKIWLAAVNACAAASPSRPLYQDESNNLANPQFTALYQSLAPASLQNPKTAQRIQNKLTYSSRNTAVTLQWIDKDIATGPTYNPNERLPRGATGLPEHEPHANEIGWDDQLTLTVRHRFALLPGPGRLLATRLFRADGGADNVSGRIITFQDEATGAKVYSTMLSASVTFTNEGLKTVMPYVEYEN